MEASEERTFMVSRCLFDDSESRVAVRTHADGSAYYRRTLPFVKTNFRVASDFFTFIPGKSDPDRQLLAHRTTQSVDNLQITNYNLKVSALRERKRSKTEEKFSNIFRPRKTHGKWAAYARRKIGGSACMIFFEKVCIRVAHVER